MQLAGDDEAVLGDGARGGLLRQAPLVGSTVIWARREGTGEKPTMVPRPKTTTVSPVMARPSGEWRGGTSGAGTRPV